MSDEQRASRDPAPAVTRAIRLLEILADAPHPCTLTSLASKLQLAKSSTANLCLALEAARMIERVGAGYRLGVRTAELGGAFAGQFNQIREFYGVCEASAALSDEIVQVAMLDGADSLYLARYEGSRTMRIGTPLGSRLPAALTATGRALLATYSNAEVRRILRGRTPFPKITERSVTTLDGLIRRLDDARERGWTIDEEESFRGVVGVAVSLDGWAPGDPQLALGVAIAAADASPDRITRIGTALTEAARALTNPFSARSG